MVVEAGEEDEKMKAWVKHNRKRQAEIKRRELAVLERARLEALKKPVKKFGGGKYSTLTEMRVAQSGGRIADENSICFCLSWDDHVDLDSHCVLPNRMSCSYSDKKPTNYISLNVDKRSSDKGRQVENIFLETKNCPDGDYRFFVRYYSGNSGSTPFTFVVN